MLKRIFPQIERRPGICTFGFQILDIAFDYSFNYRIPVEVSDVSRNPTTNLMRGLINVK